MTQERQHEQPSRSGGSIGSGGPGNSLDEVRDEMESILDAADTTLQSIGPVHAEDYIAQNRQRGGQ